ncbi:MULTISPECIES: PP2C family protein-serine/threonine phosphatase [Streptomyces]|uniref:PPM-type phosphatase domain-containing protein n=1 Tax=Streptomyces lannensis TaxID=766498 RepID=A0ABP7LLW8_9ACTN
MLTRTNELLITMNAARFASCTMLYIDPRDGQVTGASAGHVPLLCAREDDSSDIRELLGGPVLGVLTGTDYLEETFTLDEGTALVMLTDGVVEGPGQTLEAGLERAGILAGQALRDGLNAEAIADRILGAAVAVDHLTTWPCWSSSAHNGISRFVLQDYSSYGSVVARAPSVPDPTR